MVSSTKVDNAFDFTEQSLKVQQLMELTNAAELKKI